MKKEIYVIRHGETDYNKQGIIQGSGVDTSLNATGRAQAQAFFGRYEDYPFEVVLTSRLKRTHETVAPFIESGLPWEQFAAINEMCWGEHEGKVCTPEMHEDYKYINAEWKKGNFDARIRGGESVTEMAARCGDFKQQLAQRSESHILVCAHGRLIRCLMCVLLDEPLTRMDEFGHSNTGLYQLTYNNGRFRLNLSNDTAHLSQQVEEIIAL
ncbi:MAG: histidine phosphatase family protein [Bacteroidota bacterium]